MRIKLNFMARAAQIHKKNLQPNPTTIAAAASHTDQPGKS